jgi:transglutaminase-like putative cysteine protease
MPSQTLRHVTTYRYRRPVAFGEHRMMLRPLDSHDQRVIGASLEISPEPRSLRFVQDAFGNHVGIAQFSDRSKELSFESTVCLEHSPSDTADIEILDTARTLPVDYSADEMPDLATNCIERQHPDPGNEVGRWAHQFLPARPVDRRFRASHPALKGHQSRLPLPAAGSEGNPARFGLAMAAAAIFPC